MYTNRKTVYTPLFLEKARILYITDLHISFKNLDEIDIIIQAIKTYKKKVSLIIIGGDIRNKKNFNGQCMVKAEELIYQCSEIATTYILVGNHDYIDNKQFLTNEHWMNPFKKWKNVVIVDKVVTINHGFKITCVPYVPNGRFVEALNISDKHWKQSSLIFGHQEIRGCNLGKYKSITGDYWHPSYPTLISGHIHDKQRLYNVVYPGSTINQGPRNNKNAILFIKTKFTTDKRFTYELKDYFIETRFRNKIVVKPDYLYELYRDKSKNLSNTIIEILEYDNKKIKEIKKSYVFIDLFARSSYLFFAD